jgi:hypothetical protein
MIRLLAICLFTVALIGCTETKPSAAPKVEPKVEAPAKGQKPAME